MTRTYSTTMTMASPIIRTWGRLEVSGLDALPTEGPTLVIGNHDSYWDPVAIGVAGLPRRQIRALAKSTLWKAAPVGWVLDGMGQIPIVRGGGDTQALDVAIRELAGGTCIGVFPEGTISRGTRLRARSGAGRLALAVPQAEIVCVTVQGTVDIVRVPKRPSIRVEFFAPTGGPARPGESASEFIVRIMDEIRARAPIAIPGRKRTATKYRAAAAAAAPAAAGAGDTAGEGEPASSST
ncbi:MAG TPA: lysophospholipid acyltransferase family protein [Solirubrobacteraceae bacterium]|jgi:1-acyl-sn-glycerol-3-phosphate acyltransferase|nr:lysophospholipid acyltransferase family protein [Solirubrobacteraceae bacterium]